MDSLTIQRMSSVDQDLSPLSVIMVVSPRGSPHINLQSDKMKIDKAFNRNLNFWLDII